MNESNKASGKKREREIEEKDQESKDIQTKLIKSNNVDGDGGTSAGEPTKKKKKVIRIRKARQQVPRRKNLDLQAEEGGGDYNIWYHKYVGQGRDKGLSKIPAETRCSVIRDSGWTKGCLEKEPYFCLYFAKGCCDLGADCPFLHRLPTLEDEKRIPISRDCFGREKFASDRDDMGGVGSFNRECKTLYIGGLKNVQGVDVHEIACRHLREWGETDYIRMFPDRGYGFIKYKTRLCAEFAREAMQNQALDNEEVLLIKWATDDPNPIAEKRNELERKQIFINSLKDQNISLENYSFEYPKDYNPNDAKVPEHVKPTNGENNEKVESSSSASEEVQIQSNTKDSAPSDHITQTYQYYYNWYLQFCPPEQAASHAASLLSNPSYINAAYNTTTTNDTSESQQGETSTEKVTSGEVNTTEKAQESKSRTHNRKYDADYYKYINTTFKENKIAEKENAKLFEKFENNSKGLDSEVAEPYPDTNNQFK